MNGFRQEEPLCCTAGGQERSASQEEGPEALDARQAHDEDRDGRDRQVPLERSLEASWGLLLGQVAEEAPWELNLRGPLATRTAVVISLSGDHVLRHVDRCADRGVPEVRDHRSRTRSWNRRGWMEAPGRHPSSAAPTPVTRWNAVMISDPHDQLRPEIRSAARVAASPETDSDFGELSVVSSDSSIFPPIEAWT